MNLDALMGQASIRESDVTRIVRTDLYLAGDALAAIGRQRAAHAERLLRQHNVNSQAAASLLPRLW